MSSHFHSISAAQTVPLYLPVRYLTLIRSFSRSFPHLCSIGMDLDCAVVIERSDFYKPRFIL
jgi:hypothetical protein